MRRLEQCTYIWSVDRSSPGDGGNGQDVGRKIWVWVSRHDIY